MSRHLSRVRFSTQMILAGMMLIAVLAVTCFLVPNARAAGSSFVIETAFASQVLPETLRTNVTIPEGYQCQAGTFANYLDEQSGETFNTARVGGSFAFLLSTPTPGMVYICESFPDGWYYGEDGWEYYDDPVFCYGRTSGRSLRTLIGE